MKYLTNKKLLITTGLITTIFVLGFSFLFFSKSSQISQPVYQIVHASFSYQGEKGKNALVLLQEKTQVEIASSGLVTRIANRKADDTKHEYWAFYVNGKLANVGPKDYMTDDADVITWKIELY